MDKYESISIGAWLELFHTGPAAFESERHYQVFIIFRDRLVEDVELIERIHERLCPNRYRPDYDIFTRSQWARFVSSLVNAAVIFNRDTANNYIESEKKTSKKINKISKQIEHAANLIDDDRKYILLEQSKSLKQSITAPGPYHGLIKQAANTKQQKAPFLSAIWLLWKRESISNGGKYPDKMLHISHADFATLSEMVLNLPGNSISINDIKMAKQSAEKYALQDKFFS